MAAQAFFYNAIFFTYALVLTKFYGVASADVGWYILPFALGNFLGPAAARPAVRHARPARDAGGDLCDLRPAARRLRRAVPAGVLTAATQTIGWMVVFFFASPAASAAYLTVSETFPLEIRALAIAVFYAVGTGIGGVAAPVMFGWLIESGSRTSVFGATCSPRR